MNVTSQYDPRNKVFYESVTKRTSIFMCVIDVFGYDLSSCRFLCRTKKRLRCHLTTRGFGLVVEVSAIKILMNIMC